MTREEEWRQQYMALRSLSHQIAAARQAGNEGEVARLRPLFAAQLSKLKGISDAAQRESLSTFERFLLDVDKTVNVAAAGVAGATDAVLKRLVPVAIVVGVAALLIYGGALRASLSPAR